MENLALVEFYRILRIKLSVGIAIQNIELIFAVASPFVFLLYRASGRSVITGHGKPYRGTVGKHNRVLHKSFTEGSAPYHKSSVVILNSTGEDFRCRCREFVCKHRYLGILKLSVTVAHGHCLVFGSSSLGIDNHAPGRQELIGHINCLIHKSSGIVTQVEDEFLSPFVAKSYQGIEKFIICSSCELAYTDIARIIGNHIFRVNAIFRNLVSDNIEMKMFSNIFAFHRKRDFRALLAPKVSINILISDFYSRHFLAVGLKNLVAGLHSDKLRGASRNHFYHAHGIRKNLERDANTSKRSVELFVACRQF